MDIFGEVKPIQVIGKKQTLIMKHLKKLNEEKKSKGNNLKDLKKEVCELIKSKGFDIIESKTEEYDSDSNMLWVIVKK